MTKWDGAGTTSIVPNDPERRHYLILDIDKEKFVDISFIPPIDFKAFRSPSGWHIYTNYTGPICDILKIAKKLGADPAWLRIGRKRGYLFLKDYSPVHLPWPVQRAVIKKNAKTRT